MKIFKDTMRFLNLNSVIQAMKGMNEAPEFPAKTSSNGRTGRNIRHYRNRSKRHVVPVRTSHGE